MQDEFDAVPDVSDDISSLNVEIKKKKRILQRQVKTQQSQQQQYNAIFAKEGAAQDRYDNLMRSATGECNYCGSKLEHSKKLDKKIAEAERELKKHMSDRIVSEVDLKNAIVKAEQTQQEIEELENKYNEKSQILSQHTQLSRKLKALDEMRDIKYSVLKDIEVANSQIRLINEMDDSDLKEDIQDVKAKIEKQETKIRRSSLVYKERQKELDVVQA